MLLLGFRVWAKTLPRFGQLFFGGVLTGICYPDWQVPLVYLSDQARARLRIEQVSGFRMDR